MKTLRAVSVAHVIMVLGLTVGLGFSLYAQTAVQTDQTPWAGASLTDLQPLDPEAVPAVGTFYLLSDYLLTGHAAPYPFCPPVSSRAAVYLLRDDGGYFGGVFLVDDPASYGDAVLETQEMNLGLRTGESLSGLSSTMSAELDFPTEGDESGGTNEPAAMFSYSAGDLWLQIVELTNGSAWFQVHGPESDGVYRSVRNYKPRSH